jgi:RimJ/RimL family protein N-acetyltransferase
MTELPIGPPVETMPRPLPSRARLGGAYVELEPLHPRHAADLFRASAPGTPEGDASFTYLGYGPFASAVALEQWLGDFSTQQDHVAWAVRPVANGVVSGWLTLMTIEPRNAAIELGNIWLSPGLQRTRAATEAMFLPLRHAADLGYRRLVWKCNALNAPSRRAAARLGFSFEGVHRAHQVSKGRLRDTAWFSIVADEWKPCEAAFLAWLAPDNFAPDGTARRGLAELRAAPRP